MALLALQAATLLADLHLLVLLEFTSTHPSTPSSSFFAQPCFISSAMPQARPDVEPT